MLYCLYQKILMYKFVHFFFTLDKVLYFVDRELFYTFSDITCIVCIIKLNQFLSIILNLHLFISIPLYMQ